MDLLSFEEDRVIFFFSDRGWSRRRLWTDPPLPDPPSSAGKGPDLTPFRGFRES
jgi:hypothetical protein